MNVSWPWFPHNHAYDHCLVTMAILFMMCSFLPCRYDKLCPATAGGAGPSVCVANLPEPWPYLYLSHLHLHYPFRFVANVSLHSCFICTWHATHRLYAWVVEFILTIVRDNVSAITIGSPGSPPAVFNSSRYILRARFDILHNVIVSGYLTMSALLY